MKKLLITLLISICFISGCSITRIYNRNINDILDSILYVDNKLSNTYLEGYSLYLPRGVTVIDKTDYNLKVKDNNYYYYLYIDTIAYHYKVENNFVENSSHFYSHRITHDGKIGYVDIKEKGNKYFIVLMYNYAKIEAYVSKKDFNNLMMNVCSILSSIKYNDSVINENIGDNKRINQEERFNIFDSNIENDNFLKYESEYGTYNEQTDIGKDNDVIDVTETIE